MHATLDARPPAYLTYSSRRIPRAPGQGRRPAGRSGARRAGHYRLNRERSRQRTGTGRQGRPAKSWIPMTKACRRRGHFSPAAQGRCGSPGPGRQAPLGRHDQKPCQFSRQDCRPGSILATAGLSANANAVSPPQTEQIIWAQAITDLCIIAWVNNRRSESPGRRTGPHGM
jgi:hypothetical protein